MPCPFLIEEQKENKTYCECVTYVTIKGEIKNQELTSFTAQKCRNPKLYRLCPDYKKNHTKTCPECRHVYTIEQAYTTWVNGKKQYGCPKCRG